MKFTIILTTCILILLGSIGGYIATFLSTPLPWMLGSLAATAFFCLAKPQAIPSDYKFPMLLRMAFVALIGVMIGAKINAELFVHAQIAIFSLLGLTVFVPLAFYTNYLLFRRLGGYETQTAFFCAAPGGLLESITMGEARGADVSLVTTQQFMRIILVVATVPALISLWIGAPVGSAGGVSLSDTGEMSMSGIGASLIAAGAGLALARKIKLPAGQMTGPLLIAGTISLSDLVTLHLTEAMLITAQIVIGASLGSRFATITRDMLIKAIAMSVLSVGSMLILAIIIIVTLTTVTQVGFNVLFISFMPGGLIEMSLIALSLGAHPALVTLHHIFRILLTVACMGYFNRVLTETQEKGT